MSTPPFSQLDASQCAKGAYDDSTGSFRTTVVNIVEDDNGVTEVSINSIDDSITIGDTSGHLATVSGGALNVNVVSTGPGATYTNVVQYGEVDSVALGGTETVLTYTVPGTGTFYLVKIDFSGDCIAEFDLQINSSTTTKRRLSYMEFNSAFNYNSSVLPGYKLNSGTVINVIATNYSPSNLASFNATLEGVIAS